jgi:hypothetical protein
MKINKNYKIIWTKFNWINIIQNTQNKLYWIINYTWSIIIECKYYNIIKRKYGYILKEKNWKEFRVGIIDCKSLKDKELCWNTASVFIIDDPIKEIKEFYNNLKQ